MDLNKISMIALKNAEKRVKNGAKISTETESMLKHTSTEVVEAMEAYTKLMWNENRSPVCLQADFTSELADIICCVLIIAAKEELDIEKAVFDCIKKNERRANGIGDKL